MLRFSLSVGSALLILTGCATFAAEEREPSTMLVGLWDNSVQMAAAPDALKRPPVAGGAYEWIDEQYASFLPVSLPFALSDGASAIYLVWRLGGPAGPISRQRLWVFRPVQGGRFMMDFYAFKNAQDYETPAGDAAFKALTFDDLTAYGASCGLPVIPQPNGWSAEIPTTCAITARSGRKMKLSAKIVVSSDTLTYEEAGILEGGGVAFKVPGGQPYVFDRKEP